ncbi:D(2) dopamine receptor A-like [Mya arenaria]|uniref:D(2) dopamine receptor A-like n=1 Tax=Mya arenaria TaxID=6604 RepID=UPI0022E4A6DD|nr:D(2) dopamine receptor A-like [Mya arenaria]
MESNATMRLEVSRQEIMSHLLPVTILMAILGIVGLLGNMVAVAFYRSRSNRSSTVLLIMYLACFDITVCIMIIPNILEMVYNVMHTQSFLCKLTHFLGLSTVGSSCFTLMLIAIDRHQKICKPFKRMLNQKNAKFATIGFIVFSVLVSIRNFFIFDTIEVHLTADGGTNDTINGHYCTSDDDPKYSVVVTVFNAIDFLLLMSIWITILYCYSHVVYRVVKLRKKRERMKRSPTHGGVEPTHVDKPTNVDNNSEEIGVKHVSIIDTSNFDNQCHTNVIVLEQINDESYESKTDTITNEPFKSSSEVGKMARTILRDRITSDENVRRSLHVHFESSISELNDTSSGTHDDLGEHSEVESDDTSGQSDFSETSITQTFPSRKRVRRNKHHISGRERRLTYMMLAVSAVFIVCFLPFFAVRIVARIVLETGEEYELGLMKQIALRLPYLNSVFNPIVYCVFNQEFREYVWSLFRRIADFIIMFKRKMFSRKNTCF